MSTAQDNSPETQVCFLPAQLASFILKAIKVEEETEHELVNFREPVLQMAEAIDKEIKKKSRGSKKNKDTLLDKNDIKLFDAFLKALRSLRRRREGEGVSSTVIIIVVVVVVLLILLILGVIFLMRRRSN
jgi:cobalamin biosynthesis Mg chelatase CobN